MNKSPNTKASVPIRRYEAKKRGRAPGHDRLFVTALARGLQVLRCFRRERDELGTTEIARLVGLSQPTVWRLCYTLCSLEFLVRTSSDKLRLGPATLTLGHSAGATFDISEVARPRMQELANRYQAAVGLAVRDQLDMLLIERCQGEAPVILNLNAGSRVPVATTSYGWAYLAAADPSERSTIMAQLKRANAARWKDLGTRIERAVASCARKGYAVNCGVFNPNINGVGVPLLHAGRIYCLSVAGPATVLPHALLEREVGPRLRELGRWIAEECATQLGERMKTWQSSIA